MDSEKTAPTTEVGCVVLLPCPFCGTDDLCGPHFREYCGDTYSPEWWVECNRCPCGMETKGNAADLVKAWNRRVMFVVHPKELQRFCEKHDVPLQVDWKSEDAKPDGQACLEMTPAEWLKSQATEWAFRQDDMKTDFGWRTVHWICAAFKTAAEQAEREGWTRTR